ncbi:unnamed protein product [Durusdinium trenchii]|uniref:Uncharacterized protein n=1 Tax=Durusdinium trenchii TaxID=1381693 RepID=A0ABP0NZ91_9DINO
MAPVSLPNGALEKLEEEFDPELPVKICHLGQAAVAALSSLLAGALVLFLERPSGASASAAGAAAVVCAGQQSAPQLLLQALAAACGASASAGAEPMQIGAAAGLDFDGSGQVGSLFTPSCQVFRLHLAGALFAAMIAWLVLAPGLEFSLAACAILLATGSVGAAIALDPAAARRDGAGPPPVVALPVLGRQSAV